MHNLKFAVVFLLVLVLGACDRGRQDDAGGQANDGQAASSSGAEENVERQSVAVRSGEQIYRRACFSCHDNGLSGAPMLGDVQAWAPRIAKGMPLLIQSTKEGVPPAMPPNGLCVDCSDDDLAAVVEYMVSQSQ